MRRLVWTNTNNASSWRGILHGSDSFYNLQIMLCATLSLTLCLSKTKMWQNKINNKNETLLMLIKETFIFLFPLFNIPFLGVFFPYLDHDGLDSAPAVPPLHPCNRHPGYNRRSVRTLYNKTKCIEVVCCTLYGCCHMHLTTHRTCIFQHCIGSTLPPSISLN